MKETLKNMEDESGILMYPLVESVLLEHGLEPSENKEFMDMAKRRSVHHYFNDHKFRKSCNAKNGNCFLSSFVSMWLTAWKTSKVNRERMIKSFS